MSVYLRATKTGFAKLLRSRGYDIPSIRSAWFSRCRGTAWLEWLDSAGRRPSRAPRGSPFSGWIGPSRRRSA